MSAILGLLGLGAICAVDSASKNAKSKKKYNQMVAQGAFLPTDYNRFHELHGQYFHDYYTGEYKYIPKEYEGYFQRNKRAATEYIKNLVSLKEIEEGRQPTLHAGIYNKYTFNPMGGWHERYDEKIKIFNETGEFIYW